MSCQGFSARHGRGCLCGASVVLDMKDDASVVPDMGTSDMVDNASVVPDMLDASVAGQTWLIMSV